jgi:hypothetical protein
MQNPRGAMRVERVLRARHSRVAALELLPRRRNKMHLPPLISLVRRRCICVCLAACVRAESYFPAVAAELCLASAEIRRPDSDKPLFFFSPLFASRHSERDTVSLSCRRRTTLSINFTALMQSYCLICMVIDGGTRVERELLPFRPPPSDPFRDAPGITLIPFKSCCLQR